MNYNFRFIIYGKITLSYDINLLNIEYAYHDLFGDQPQLLLQNSGNQIFTRSIENHKYISLSTINQFERRFFMQ